MNFTPSFCQQRLSNGYTGKQVYMKLYMYKCVGMHDVRGQCCVDTTAVVQV